MSNYNYFYCKNCLNKQAGYYTQVLTNFVEELINEFVPDDKKEIYLKKLLQKITGAKDEND